MFFSPPKKEEVARSNVQDDRLAIILHFKPTTSTERIHYQAAHDSIKAKIDRLSIHNGMLGTPYKLLIDLQDSRSGYRTDAVELEKFEARNLKNIGLQCECISPTTIKISGTPTKDFDGKLYFILRFTHQHKEVKHEEPEHKETRTDNPSNGWKATTITATTTATTKISDVSIRYHYDLTCCAFFGQ